MTYTFIVETDQPNNDGDMIMMDGVSFNDEIKVLDGWHRHKVISTNPIVFREGNVLKCTADIPSQFLDRWPIICFDFYRKSKNKMVGSTYPAVKITHIVLHNQPNNNTSIKTIREQCLSK